MADRELDDVDDLTHYMQATARLTRELTAERADNATLRSELDEQAVELARTRERLDTATRRADDLADELSAERADRLRAERRAGQVTPRGDESGA